MKIRSAVKAQYPVLFSLFLFLVILTPISLAAGKPTTTDGPKRLTETKLKACQAKENAIKKRTEQLTKMATNMLEKFDAIAGRVKEYYVSKVAPSGKKVANYDKLVADIQTKKVAVQTVLATAQTDAGKFACDSNEPKEQLNRFRNNMQAVKSALKDYRTSIRNLIVAVHSVTGTDEKTK